jgi:lysophospholipase L1-like esterase
MHVMLTVFARVRLSSGLLVACVLASLGLASAERGGAQAVRRLPIQNHEQWEKEIAAFEASDRERHASIGGVLFIGSSSIRLWTTLGQDFPNQPVLNRGFGGSRIADSTHFASRIVFPYKPRLIVMYAGGNDLNDGNTPEDVLTDFQAFVDAVRRGLPATRIAYISIAGNPARWSQVDRVKKANALIEAYTKQTPNMAFIDIFPHMLGPDGQPRPELFVADRLHMSPAGYAIWKRIVGPFLETN